jgi:monoamine oxidase
MARAAAAAETDVLVIGAGAAGLAAAHTLSRGGHHCTVVEARNRIGGRVFTGPRGIAPIPLELGAEFIHGKSKVTFDWLRAAGDVAIDTARERWMLQRGRLQKVDNRFAELERHFRRLRAPEPDVALDEFLRRHSRRLPRAVIELACAMVEGFDAADASRVSAREVLEEWSGPAAAGGSTFRPARGYGALLQYMASALNPARVALRLETIVRSVKWRKGSVEIEALRLGEIVRLRAPRVIVTLPLGVLQLPENSPGFVRFAPGLGRVKRKALGQLASGPVIRLALTFARPFWEELHDGRHRDAAFFFAPKAAFPTFWTALPARAATLVAWTAGPNAVRLNGLGEAGIVAQLLATLRSLFGRQDYAALLENIAWHDWQADPYACGAYSYVLAQGAKARQALARPLQETLYFAGEACDTAGEPATVAGALRSGAQAAEQILSLRRER